MEQGIWEKFQKTKEWRVTASQQHDLTPMLLVANIMYYAKNLKMTENLAHGYSSESAQQELSNEYQHDRV